MTVAAALTVVASWTRTRPYLKATDFRAMRVVIYATTLISSLLWTYFAGKDLNWDAINYHLYAGFSALNDRFETDFLASGPPAYFNPYAHVPLYLMVRAGLPSILIGAVLACLHCLIVWLTYELAGALNRRPDGSVSPFVTVFAVVVAMLNPVLLQQIGSTFIDVTTGTLVLGGWVALANAFRTRSVVLILAAGGLLGAATALKLSNSLFAIAALPVVFLVDHERSRRWFSLSAFSLMGAVGFAIAAGPWAWRLWEEFGNPFFPWLNQVFKSPDFTTASLKHYRFVPESLSSALLRPFEMALPLRLVHTEVKAPDLRYAILALLPLVFVGLSALDRLSHNRRPPDRAIHATFDDASNRALWAITLGFGIAWCLWLSASGNSRYFIPMACVAAVLLASFFYRLFRTRRRVLIYVVAIVSALQVGQLVLGSELRWNPTPWRGPFIAVAVHDRFRGEPYLFLSMGAQSNSFLAPFVATDSGFINISGGYILGPGAPGAGRAESLIRKNASRLRTLTPVYNVTADGTPIPPSVDAMNGPLERFGLRVDPVDCDYFYVQRVWDTINWVPAGKIPTGSRDTNAIYTCRIVQSDHGLDAYRRRETEVKVVFDRVEDACPSLFQPPRQLSEKGGSQWLRVYMNTDLKLWINDGWVQFFDPIRGGDTMLLGRESDWARAPQKLECGRINGHSYARLVGPS